MIRPKAGVALAQVLLLLLISLACTSTVGSTAPSNEALLRSAISNLSTFTFTFSCKATTGNLSSSCGNGNGMVDARSDAIEVEDLTSQNRVITIGSTSWTCPIITVPPPNSCFVSSNDGPQGNDPLSWARLLLQEGSGLHGASPHSLHGMPVTSIEGTIVPAASMEVVVSFDSHNTIRRVVTIQPSSTAQDGTESPAVTETYILSSFGVPVSIAAPPSGSVAPGSSAGD